MPINGEDGDSKDPKDADETTTRPVTHDVPFSLDATLELLANRERRDVLSYLVEAPEQTATVEELVDHLVTRNVERTDERPSHGHVEATLHHIHMPKLADAGVIDFDPGSQVVRYWGDDMLEDWLARIRAEETE